MNSLTSGTRTKHEPLWDEREGKFALDQAILRSRKGHVSRRSPVRGWEDAWERLGGDCRGTCAATGCTTPCGLSATRPCPQDLQTEHVLVCLLVCLFLCSLAKDESTWKTARSKGGLWTREADTHTHTHKHTHKHTHTQTHKHTSTWKKTQTLGIPSEMQILRGLP